MATESHGAGAARGADPITRGVLGRLASSAQSEGVDEAARTKPADAGDGRVGDTFLPDLPDPALLLAVLGAWHRRGVEVGFPELKVGRP